MQEDLRDFKKELEDVLLLVNNKIGSGGDFNFWQNVKVRLRKIQKITNNGTKRPSEEEIEAANFGTAMVRSNLNGALVQSVAFKKLTSMLGMLDSLNNQSDGKGLDIDLTSYYSRRK